MYYLLRKKFFNKRRKGVNHHMDKNGCLKLPWFYILSLKVKKMCAYLETVLWIRIRIQIRMDLHWSGRLDPDPSGQKWPTKKWEKCFVLKCCMFSFEDCSPVAWSFFLEAWGGGGYIEIFCIKYCKQIFFFFKIYNFWSSILWIRTALWLTRIRNTA